jgi:hypothetical protein
MLVELITPLLIATAPVRIDLPVITYDHQTQQSSQLKGRIDVAQRYTMSGTQTYDFRGQPHDSDND